MEFLGIVKFSFTTYYEKEVEKEKCPCVKLANKRKNALMGRFFTEEEGLEPPSLTAAVFKTADLPISVFLQRAGKE